MTRPAARAIVAQIAGQISTMTGDDYRACREAMGMTQSNLAHVLKVSRRTIVRLESAAEVPKSDEYAIAYLVRDMAESIARDVGQKV